jgi:hypothetical protein
MIRNKATTIRLFAYDSATGKGKPGDAANIIASVSIDDAAPVDLVDVTANEVDPVKATGFYDFDVAPAENDGFDLLFTARSSTAGVVVVALRVETEDALWKGTLAGISNATITLPAGHGLHHEGNYAVVLAAGTDARGKSRYLAYSGAGEVWNVDPAWNSDGETLPSGTLIASIIPAPKLPTAALPNVNVMKVNDAAQTAGDIVALLMAGLTLTAGERTAIANEVEAQIIDETDSEKVLTAITNKIASVNPSLSGLSLGAIAIAVRDVLNTAPAVNSLGAHVKAVADRTPGAGTLSTAADVTAAQTAITNAIAALNNLSPAGAQAAVAAALLAYAAAKTSDVTALNNISAAGVQAAVAAALAAYSAATTGNVGAVPAAVLTAAQAAPIHARIKIVNATPIQGTGVAGDPMRPA